jgi:GNAT superfamily N-acetyltransferase
MRIDVTEEPLPDLAEYARVPIAFEVRAVLDVAADGGGGFVLSERAIHPPYVKDYDALERPESWAERFDLARWGWFAARRDGRRVGGAAVAFDAPDVHLLEGRRDLAVLWDIRVAPDARGHGIGAALFRAAQAWAAARGCRRLKVETQNVNVPACRFYARMGCRLGAVHPAAYPGLPDETQLLWYRDLPG